MYLGSLGVKCDEIFSLYTTTNLLFSDKFKSDEPNFFL